ncbi:hypothetical protein FQN57_002120 [Myotisia sp. PD_48]|nr:hypothetical protein FQN57_002120 [Myotisia sp. PD_48]
MSNHHEKSTNNSGQFFSSLMRSNPRVRSKSPHPIDTVTGQHHQHYHQYEQASPDGNQNQNFHMSPQTTSSPSPMYSDGTMSPTSPTEPSKKKRHSSSSTSRKSSDHKRRSSTLSHYGRHGNDWLFGGYSVRDHVSKLWKDDQSEDERTNS